MISAIGSDVVTWHPHPRSYEMQEALDLGGAEPLLLVKRHSRTLGQASIYGGAAARWSILAGRSLGWIAC
jgi:hypothetical protein